MLLEDKLCYFNEDDEVEQDIRDELADHEVGRRCLVGIRVEHGVAQLTGCAETYAQKWAIEYAVSRVIGVREVRDYLEVRPSGDAQPEDNQIKAAAHCALEWDARVPAGVHVDVTDGVLRLKGVVERFAQRAAAEEAVRNLIGIRDVANEIKITPVVAPLDVQPAVRSALRRRFGIACRHVWVVAHDGVVTLTGAVATFGLADDIERIVHSVPGVVRVDNRLFVT